MLTLSVGMMIVILGITAARGAHIRTARLDERYHWEPDKAKRLYALSILSYMVISFGVTLIVVASGA